MQRNGYQNPNWPTAVLFVPPCDFSILLINRLTRESCNTIVVDSPNNNGEWITLSDKSAHGIPVTFRHHQFIDYANVNYFVYADLSKHINKDYENTIQKHLDVIQKFYLKSVFVLPYTVAKEKKDIIVGIKNHFQKVNYLQAIYAGDLYTKNFSEPQYFIDSTVRTLTTSGRVSLSTKGSLYPLSADDLLEVLTRKIFSFSADDKESVLVSTPYKFRNFATHLSSYFPGQIDLNDNRELYKTTKIVKNRRSIRNRFVSDIKMFLHGQNLQQRKFILTEIKLKSKTKDGINVNIESKEKLVHPISQNKNNVYKTRNKLPASDTDLSGLNSSSEIDVYRRKTLLYVNRTTQKLSAKMNYLFSKFRAVFGNRFHTNVSRETNQGSSRKKTILKYVVAATFVSSLFLLMPFATVKFAEYFITKSTIAYDKHDYISANASLMTSSRMISLSEMLIRLYSSHFRSEGVYNDVSNNNFMLVKMIDVMKIRLELVREVDDYIYELFGFADNFNNEKTLTLTGSISNYSREVGHLIADNTLKPYAIKLGLFDDDVVSWYSHLIGVEPLISEISSILLNEKAYIVLILYSKNTSDTGRVEEIGVLNFSNGELIETSYYKHDEFGIDGVTFSGNDNIYTDFGRTSSIDDYGRSLFFPENAKEIVWFMDVAAGIMPEIVFFIDTRLAASIIERTEEEITLQAVVDKMVNPNYDRFKMFRLVGKELLRKNAVVYSTHGETATILEKLGVSGASKAPACKTDNCYVDYLQIGTQALPGYKNRNLDKSVSINVRFEEGVVKREVSVRLTNTSEANSEINLGLFVPLESSFSDIEISNSSTVLPTIRSLGEQKECALQVSIRPNEVIVIKFLYETPSSLSFEETGEYNLFLSKQIFSEDIPYSIYFNLPFRFKDKIRLNNLTDEDKLIYNTLLSKDELAHFSWE